MSKEVGDISFDAFVRDLESVVEANKLQRMTEAESRGDVNHSEPLRGRTSHRFHIVNRTDRLEQ
jgi:hypothetical protein